MHGYRQQGWDWVGAGMTVSCVEVLSVEVQVRDGLEGGPVIWEWMEQGARQ